jgi:D-alanyl-D-alanine carboxypeptidase
MKKLTSLSRIYLSLRNVPAIIITVLYFVSNASSQTNIKSLEAKLDETVDSFYVNDSLPGITVMIKTPSLTYNKAVGKADLKTGTERKYNDKIRIGSITKTFVATVILQLVDSGKIGLDDKLEKYYPDYPNSSNITVRQMLDMTSGIPDYIEDPAVLKSFVYDRLDKYTPMQLYEITKSMKPDFPPGTGWKYSNGNYNILGMMIEKVTGNKIEDEITRRIINPLGLKNTIYPVTPYLEGQYSHGYMSDTLTGELIDVTVIDPSIPWAAGCMISDLPDLKIYAKALANGIMISPELQKERLKFINTGVSKFVGYGLGIFSLEGFLGHNGGITGYNTTMCYDTELDALILVSVNEYGADGGKSDAVFVKLAQILFPEKNLFKK